MAVFLVLLDPEALGHVWRNPFGDRDGNKLPTDPFSLVSGPLYHKLSTCFEGAWLTQLVQLVTASRLFLGHKG